MVLKVATLEGVTDAIERSTLSQIELSKQQIEEIVKALVSDYEVMETEKSWNSLLRFRLGNVS
ncbi:hypothetical protein QQP08_011594 [Theobroma cacao]|nr:hypothetical protein QQP08_011594 [Theobroma cacao]